MEARAVRRMSSGGEEDNRSVSSGRGSWASGAEDKKGFHWVKWGRGAYMDVMGEAETEWSGRKTKLRKRCELQGGGRVCWAAAGDAAGSARRGRIA